MQVNSLLLQGSPQAFGHYLAVVCKQAMRGADIIQVTSPAVYYRQGIA
jgi:hypothetical protein